MFTYGLYQMKNGKTILTSETRSPFPPEDERGRTVIINRFKTIQKAGFKDAYAVALLNSDGTQTWFNSQGQVVDKARAFGAS